MKHLAWLITGSLFSGIAVADCDSFLIGAWRSDARLTIGSIENVRPVDDEDRANFEEMLGKMTMTFTCAEVTVDWGEPGARPTVAPFTQLDSSETHATVEFLDREGNRSETVHYELEGNCIKRLLRPEGWYEYFCRTKQAE